MSEQGYQVSARKYRPQLFEEVVGQQPITETLIKAINTNQLAQAYLFCGPRGVGKTTCARIFAKTINLSENEEIHDFSFNIFELDAASNNSVEDIRNLTDQVRVSPQVGKYKVYIIDEVHMLSQAAFNAFLKTLEEPPPHAIFILATTEKHKIIPTILSRCQIFDFNRITVQNIADHLAKIAEKESISAEKEALYVIAEKADGALRDALSIYDQMVSFSGNNVTYADVIKNLNILDYDYYFKMTTVMLEADIHSVLLQFDEIISNGFDGHHFLGGMGAHFRNLLVCKDEITLKLLEVGEQVKINYRTQAQECNAIWLLQALKLINQADVQYKTSQNQRLLVELTLMQICSIGSEAEKKKSKPSIIPPPSSKSPTSETPTAEAKPVNYRKQEEIKQPEIQEPAPLIVKEEIQQKRIVEQPKVKINQEKIGSISSTISINTLLNKNGVKEVEEDVEEHQEADSPKKPEEEFSLENLTEAWNNYAEELKSKGKESFSSTLTRRKPQLVDKNTILFEIDNKVQEQDFEIERVDLMDFLRAKLSNYNVQLNVKITERKEESVQLYTNQQKFEHMAKKNPQLLELSKRLDLDPMG